MSVVSWAATIQRSSDPRRGGEEFRRLLNGLGGTIFTREGQAELAHIAGRDVQFGMLSDKLHHDRMSPTRRCRRVLEHEVATTLNLELCPLQRES